VICLLSALAYHDLTTQVPHEVQIAMERNMLIPRLNYPPIRVFRFSRAAFAEGAESHEIDGVPMRIYSPEKTLADCFKFRNKIGLDTVIESLRLYRERRKIDVGGLMRFAAVCRVAKAMRPYLESLL
jgi:predicted transcriptional regulator of viral defense system